MTKEKADTIVITGFGPFGDYKVNASWQAVKALMAMPEVDKLPVKLVAAEVPVSYKDVLQKVPEFHKNENPVLMIHVGVSRLAKKITLERCANNTDYNTLDVDGNLPADKCCLAGSDSCVTTVLDVESMAEDLNQADIGVAACTSENAGRYLCEFIYYRSLNQNDRRSLFVHVPELDNPYSAEELGKGLYEVVRIAVKQLSENEIGDKEEGASAL